MTNLPKKPSEIIHDKVDLLADNEGSNEAKYIAVILDFLDSQADAYTTGYNQALKDVNAKLSE